MTKNTKVYSSNGTGGEAILHPPIETPRPFLNEESQANQRQVSGFYAYYRKEHILTQSMRTIVDGFLGWTTEFLNFVPVGDTYALVDGNDTEKVLKLNWYLQKGQSGIYYALAILKSGKRKRTIRMHQLILPSPEGCHVDHKDRNGLDNRRTNLRIATPSQNHANQRNQITRKRLSRYKGVTKNKQKWNASLVANGERRYLGVFGTEEEAAIAYNEAAKKCFGEFARINTIEAPNEH